MQFVTGVYEVFSVCSHMQYMIWLKQNNNQSNHCQVPKMTVSCKWVLSEVNYKYWMTLPQNVCEEERTTTVLHSSMFNWPECKGSPTAAANPCPKLKINK